MSDTDSLDKNAKLARRSLYASMAFYVLIAFEFFYMASPFAAYFYAVYGPGLDWLQGFGPANWTIRFFLPHAIEATSSPFVAILEPLGIVMFLGGLVAFAIGAFQIYRAKLLRKEAVVSGLYKHIRHPQYLALIVSSIGMALVWPRFLVLIGTVTVIFVYIALAKTEERICLDRYEGYDDYMKQTGMFLPRRFSPGIGAPLGEARWARIVTWLLVYAVTLVGALSIAALLRIHSTASLIRWDAPEGVYISAAPIAESDLGRIADIVRSTPEVQNEIARSEAPLIVYVLPQNMYVAEMAMHLPEGETFGHSVPRDLDGTSYKAIVTRAILGEGVSAQGVGIIRRAFNKTPLVEVSLDLNTATVKQVLPAPQAPLYGEHQVPLF